VYFVGALLKKIHDPDDLKRLTVKELEQLSTEIRDFIVTVISRQGGHLASSLGVVELTVALYSVFHAPEDKIIWDVGHQSYTHKILTGRKEQFKNIRSLDGICGFPKRQESIYDVFSVGHSSTSLSAALGMARARDLKKGSNHIIAVIGDGALTGGMAFEALNYAGEANTDLIVILNDNEFSIDQNVGGLPSYLARLRTDPKYSRLKEDLEHILSRIPHIGKTMVRSVERVKDSVKYLLVPGILFEELGFTYLGPINGHSIPQVQGLLRQAKTIQGPVLIHTVTTKGKGYEPAEREPEKFHGVGKFDKETGKFPSKKITTPTYSSLFGSTLTRLASQDKSIVALTAAMASGTGLDSFARKLPDRFIDVGIAEQNAVTMAAGLAAEGFKPVVAIYSTFLQRAYDQILHDVCLQELPVIFAIDRAGLVGEDGETHNGVFDLSYLRHLPGMTIMAPGSGAELKEMLQMALTLDSPVAIRYPKGAAAEPLPPDLCNLDYGKGKLLQEGEDVLLLAVGATVKTALQAYDLLLAEGISACVINPRFIVPLDRQLICSWAKRCKYVITIEENIVSGGFGSAVLEALSEEGLTDLHIQMMGVHDPFTGQGTREQILETVQLTAQSIALKAKQLCKGREKVK